MVQSAGMNQSLLYDQVSCRLRVDGLPDVSAGHGGQTVGIVTGWSLQWLGRPELEGRREHLQALIEVVLPYARHLLSGVARPFGTGGQPISLEPSAGGGHSLTLRSSQSDTPPLQIELDDAQLADLVRVLDQVRLDPRLQLPLPVPPCRPLRARELIERVPLQRRLAAPLGGAIVLAASAAMVALLPAPSPTGRPAGSVAPKASPAPSAPTSPSVPPRP
jgi:hypothetical protein